MMARFCAAAALLIAVASLVGAKPPDLPYDARVNCQKKVIVPDGGTVISGGHVHINVEIRIENGAVQSVQTQVRQKDGQAGEEQEELAVEKLEAVPAEYEKLEVMPAEVVPLNPMPWELQWIKVTDVEVRKMLMKQYSAFLFFCSHRAMQAGRPDLAREFAALATAVDPKADGQNHPPIMARPGGRAHGGCTRGPEHAGCTPRPDFNPRPDAPAIDPNLLKAIEAILESQKKARLVIEVENQGGEEEQDRVDDAKKPGLTELYLDSPPAGCAPSSPSPPKDSPPAAAKKQASTTTVTGYVQKFAQAMPFSGLEVHSNKSGQVRWQWKVRLATWEQRFHGDLGCSMGTTTGKKNGTKVRAAQPDCP